MTPFPAASIKERAYQLGFSFAGITRAEPSPTLNAYLTWVAQEMHGTMGYLSRPDRVARRRDLNLIVPGVRALVMVGLEYGTGQLPPELLHDPSRGRIAAYAWGSDYHEVMLPRLEALAAWLDSAAQDATSAPPQQRVYVDTGAVLERSHAQQAGIGFTGKNTMLIHPRRGSSFFLGELLTTLDVDVYDTPHRPTLCGRCTRCLVDCPTQAFPRPYVLDSRRCISYLTIEHKGWVDPGLRPLMGSWVYGCDICQDVCPWQRFAQPTPEAAFYPAGADRAAPPLLDLLALDEASFLHRFRGSAITRIKRERLVRNACIAAGNWGHAAAAPALARLLHDDASPLVRGHAAWALGRIPSAAARAALTDRQPTEADPLVQAEIAAALAGPAVPPRPPQG